MIDSSERLERMLNLMGHGYAAPPRSWCCEDRHRTLRGYFAWMPWMWDETNEWYPLRARFWNSVWDLGDFLLKRSDSGLAATFHARSCALSSPRDSHNSQDGHRGG